MDATLPFDRPDPLTPPAEYARLRVESPVLEIDGPHGPAWLVTTASLASAALADPRLTMWPPGAPDEPADGSADERASLFQDGPAHARLRRLVAGAFRPTRMATLRAGVEAHAEAGVDRLLAAGPPADLVEALAAPLPIAVIGELLGIDPGEHHRFRTLVDATLVADPLTGDPEAVRACAELSGFAAELVVARRRAPGEDLLSHLVAVRDTDDGRLSDGELVALVSVLVGAGALTVRAGIALAVVRLLTEGMWERVGAASSVELAALVEEVLRLVGAEPFPRFAAQELELGGVAIPAGAMVLLRLEAANRDPARFAEPDVFRPGRPEPHLGFGHGPHFCLGASLARVEISGVLTVLARRLPTLALATPLSGIPWYRGPVDHGPLALPVSWAPPQERSTAFRSASR